MVAPTGTLKVERHFLGPPPGGHGWVWGGMPRRISAAPSGLAL